MDPEERSSLSQFDNPPDENTCRFLLLTDTHLGFLEKDEIRGEDSFKTFEEALKIAIKLKVECILFGGDLFHDNKPSKYCMTRCIQLLRQYCLGSKQLDIKVISDQKQAFAPNTQVNYEDENFNIALPIFAIHGNHDDPAGFAVYSALEVLHSANLINYFGKAQDIENIEIKPIILNKGDTNIALYGLGNIRDERLRRAFQNQQVHFIKPEESDENATTWFHMFMIHQNRIKHSSHSKDSIPEDLLPEFLDIVYWGHEHESDIQLKKSLYRDFFITQPGSTVVTQLMPGEARQKNVAVLEVCRDQCRCVEIPLTSTRPFFMKEIVLSNYNELLAADETQIEEFLMKHVTKLLDSLKNKEEEIESKNDQQQQRSILPLIRLRVDCTNFPTINTQRFGQQFVDKVANPSEIIIFHRKPCPGNRKTKDKKGIGDFDQEIDLAENDNDTREVKDLVADFLPALKIHSTEGLSDAIQAFVEKTEIHAIEEFVHRSLISMQNILEADESLETNDDVLKSIETNYKEYSKNAEKHINTPKNKKNEEKKNEELIYEKRKRKKPTTNSKQGRMKVKNIMRKDKIEADEDNDSIDDSIDEDDIDSSSSSKRKRSKNVPPKRLAVARPRRAATSKRKKYTFDDEDEDND